MDFELAKTRVLHGSWTHQALKSWGGKGETMVTDFDTACLAQRDTRELMGSIKRQPTFVSRKFISSST